MAVPPIPPANPSQPDGPDDRARPPARLEGVPSAPSPADVVDTAASGPPPELRAELSAAARAAAELAASDRELRFEIDGGRVRIELRDLRGNVLRVIPPSVALEIASGADPDGAGSDARA